MDRYKKLKPPKQTPNSEICKCSGRPPLVLQPSLTYNPISCADCNLEVDLNQLNFSIDLFNKIADWRDFYYCFYKLWLDSGEFEEWAKEQLSLPNSAVNKRALILKEEIKLINECFYWWFVDNSSSDHKILKSCPNCNKDLIKRENKFNINTAVCSHCNIIVAS